MGLEGRMMDMKEKWEKECQPFEQDFQSNQNYRWDKESFEAAWAKHFSEWCEFDQSAFGGQVILDVGCGSRCAIDYFRDAVKYYNDPLINTYIKIPQVSAVWDQYHIRHSLCSPAEVYWNHMQTACSFINCWNVLDHCYNWRDVVRNIIDYARTGCYVAIATDTVPHKGHIGIDDGCELYNRLAAEFDVVKEKPGYWGRQHAWLLKKK